MTLPRWTIEFQQHPFQAVWTQLKDSIEELKIDNEIVQSSMQEIVRLKRVVTYLDSLISTIDPELTPKSVWENFHGQVTPCLQQIQNYISNKNINHIQQANEHADNLLTYVRPYQVLPKDALEATKDASLTYASTLNTYMDEIRTKSAELLQEIQEDKASTSKDRATSAGHRTKIETFFNGLFSGTSETPSIESQINTLLTSSKEMAKSIEELHSTMVVGTPQALSIQARVKSAETEIESTRDKLNKLLDGAQDEVRSLNAFHEKVYGNKDENGKFSGGLQSELGTRFEDLSRLESEQKIKYAALVSKIESLLPGATSAGLASSYKALKDHFAAPIQQFTLMFYASLGLLILAAVVMAVETVAFSPLQIKLVDIKEWDAIFRAMIYKAPFVAPVIWLAIFSSTRRSQYERLQQEYAHKEALASSYDSFKRQLEALQSEDDKLQHELIARAIDAIAYNASITLDGKHTEKLPSQRILEKLSTDELKKLIDAFKALKEV